MNSVSRRHLPALASSVAVRERHVRNVWVIESHFGANKNEPSIEMTDMQQRRS